MKTKNFITGNNTLRIALACAVLSGVGGGGVGVGRAQDAQANASPGLQQVVNLSKAGMSDDFIETYITNSGRTYALSVNDIIYLHQQGVSDNVIKALMQPPSAANPNPAPTTTVNSQDSAPTTDTSAPPPPDAGATAPGPDAGSATPPTLDYFQDQLAPYGNWVPVAGYGQCWQPSVYPGWRPYCDGGHWVYTDSGWYWQSDYPWGDIPFHYGRWMYTSVGWVWVPGYQYAPAWVVWRHADDDDCVGWAPLPPGAVFFGGCWTFNGAAVGFGFGFGLGASYFTFVDYDHFWVHDYRTCLVPRDRLVLIFQRSECENRFREEHGRFFNDGLDRDRVARFSHHDFQPEREMDLRREGAQRHQADFHNGNHGSNPGWSGGNHDGNHGQGAGQQQTPYNNGVHQNNNNSAPNHNQSGGGQHHQSWNGVQQPGQAAAQNSGQDWQQGRATRPPQTPASNNNNDFNHRAPGVTQPNLAWNSGQQPDHPTFKQNGGGNWNEGQNVRPPQPSYSPATPHNNYNYAPTPNNGAQYHQYPSGGEPQQRAMPAPAPHAAPSAPQPSQGGGHSGNGNGNGNGGGHGNR